MSTTRYIRTSYFQIDYLSYILLDKPRFIDRSKRQVEQDHWDVVNASAGN